MKTVKVQTTIGTIKFISDILGVTAKCKGFPQITVREIASGKHTRYEAYVGSKAGWSSHPTFQSEGGVHSSSQDGLAVVVNPEPAHSGSYFAQQP
jgi:hypothetical protein